MAKMNNLFEIKGALGKASFYKPKGSSDTLVRAKGGPTKRRLKVGPEFATVRKHQKEWEACVRFSQMVARSLGAVYKMADYNVSAVWNGVGKRIIQLDEVNALGERNLEISKCREALEGFNLNRKFTFNSVLRIEPQYSIDRETFSARVVIPRVNPEYDLYNVQKLPYYRIELVLGGITDIIYNPEGYKGEYYGTNPIDMIGCKIDYTSEWFSTIDTNEEMIVELQFPKNYDGYFTHETSFLLGIGIQFAKIGFLKKIEPVKYACCGKILMVK